MMKIKIFYLLIIVCIFCGTLTGVIMIANYKNQNNNNSNFVSIAAACTEIIYALGSGDQIVGVDQYSINYALIGETAFQGAPGQLILFPQEVPNKTNVGTTSSVNLELLSSLNPAIVFSWEWASTVNAAIENLGFQLFKINPQSIADVLNLTITIGNLLEKPLEATTVNQEIISRISNITSKLEGLSESEKPLIYYELSSLGKTIGNGTITNEMISVAGGINLAGNESLRYPTLSSEYIVARNPDIIILISYGASISEVKSRAGWSNITAVVNDDIYTIESGWVTASPRLILGLEQFAEWFHPTLF